MAKKAFPLPPDLSSARAIGRERELSRQKARLARAGEGFLRALYRGMAFTNYVSLLRETKTDFNRCSSNSLLYFPSPCCDSFGNSPFSTAFYPTVSPPEDTESERIFLLLSLYLFPPEGESWLGSSSFPPRKLTHKKTPSLALGGSSFLIFPD